MTKIKSSAIGNDIARQFDTVTELEAARGVEVGAVVQVAERASGIFDAVLTSGVSPNGYNIIESVADTSISFVLRVGGESFADQFGLAGDGSNESLAVSAWFNYLASNPDKKGVANNATFLINSVSTPTPNGIFISGNATFKATGVNRLNMIELIGATGDISIDGITIDGSDIVARPFEVKNISSATDGNVYISSSARFINAKNNSPLTHNAAGCRVQGNFQDVIFEGEIDAVDNDMTNGAVSVGFWFDWTTTFFIKNALITSKARVKNVKNSNTVTADADGVQRMAPTSEHTFFTVESGAYFENCEGRSIKSQCVSNAIDSPIIVRDAYDGLTEIDLQYGGGYIKNARIYYDGVRVDAVCSTTSRLNLPNQCTISGNELTIINPPAIEVGSMAFVWGVDTTDSIKQQGVNIYDNKVFGGAVDYMATVYCANVVDTNRVIIRDNFAELIAESFVNFELVFNNSAQLNIVFENNGCGSQCPGITVVSSGQLVVESDKNNNKISPLPSKNYTISGGVLTLYGGTSVPVVNEGGAGFDDVDTITGINYSNDDIVTFRAPTSEAPRFMNGTGNLHLAGSNFELNNERDRLQLQYDAISDEWCEVSRSNNGT